MFDFLLSKPKAPDAGDIVRLRNGSLQGPIEYVGDADGDDACFRALNDDGDVLEWDDEGYAISKVRAHDIVQTSQSTRDFVSDGDVLVYGDERWKVTHADWRLREIFAHRIHPLTPGKRRYIGCFGSYYDGGKLYGPDAIISSEAWLDLEPAKPVKPVEHVEVSFSIAPGGQQPAIKESIDQLIDQIDAKLDFGTPPEQFADGMTVEDRYTLRVEVEDEILSWVNLPGTQVKELRTELRDALHGGKSFVTFLHEAEEIAIRSTRILGYSIEKET
jgi:hypothetical protein